MTNSDPVTRLLDLEAIRALKARYFRHLDEKDWPALRDVFTADATFETDGYTTDGADAFVAFLQKVLAGTRTVHHGHMPEIDLVDDTHARGVWAMFDMVEFAPSEDGGRQGIVGYGHYCEDYRKVDGEWRIARLVLTRLRVDPLAAAVPLPD